MARLVLFLTVLIAIWLSGIESTVVPKPACYPTKAPPTTCATKATPPPTKPLTKAPTTCATKATPPPTKPPTKAPTTCATKATPPPTKPPTKAPTTCATKATQPPTKATPPPTKATTTCATKATSPTTKATSPTTKATSPTTKATPPPTKPKCGVNEEYSECGNNACQNTCKSPRISMVCKAACKSGCICKEGYLRNSKNQCVLEKNCDCTGQHEVWSSCDNHPCQNTCESPNLIAACTYAPGCYPGCICKKGYLRNSNGVCTPQRQCYKCKANEEFKDNGSFACESTCAEPDLNTRCDPTPNGEPGCFCRSGFLRNEGECVARKDCPNQCKGAHEVFSDCAVCQKDCTTYDMDVACKEPCKPGCICEEGFVRNKKGVCVKPDECENRKCSKKNEVYSKCVAPCGEKCSNLGQDLVCNLAACVAGCDCKPGFFRNSKNECVAADQCDCGANAELDKCFNPCPPRTCDAIGKQFKCAAIDPDKCKPGCKCVFNYRRDFKGDCVPIQQCPPLKCTGENEEYNACPASCLDERCKSLIDPLMCTAEVRECAPQCVCKPGHLRNDDGKCIPKAQCREFCSDPNAIFTKCGNACPITCDNIDKERNCSKKCLSGGGCVCKDGYVEDKNGKCILPKDCPPKFTCGKNEVYNSCPNSCPPQETCKTYLDGGLAVDCPEETGKKVCKPRCECKPGFVKDSSGACVHPDQCCGDPNAEVVSCPNPCPGGTCEAPEFVPCKAPCRVRGCQCKSGYVKNSNGKCILLSDCPKKCGENESWNNCDDPKAVGCIKGCHCNKGFVKKNGKCVKFEEPKECGENETWNNCDDPKAVGCIKGCHCNPGFVRKDGKCVKPHDVPTCGKHEHYVGCVPLVQQTCATLSTPACLKNCKPGCACIEGYVRECKGGKCIKKCDCKPY